MSILYVDIFVNFYKFNKFVKFKYLIIYSKKKKMY